MKDRTSAAQGAAVKRTAMANVAVAKEKKGCCSQWLSERHCSKDDSCSASGTMEKRNGKGIEINPTRARSRVSTKNQDSLLQ